MTFAAPELLLILALIPVLAALYVGRERRRSRVLVRFTNVRLLSEAAAAVPEWTRWAPPILFLAALLALGIGIARPRAVVGLPREDASVILLMDTSGSMVAADIDPNRARAAEGAAKRFINRVPSTIRIGVVYFTTTVRVAAPLSTDRIEAREGIELPFPNGGTAMGDAIVASLFLDPNRGLSPNEREGRPPTAILLLSDGNSFSGKVEPITAAKRASEQGVPIHTIVLGPEEGAPRTEIDKQFDRPDHETMQRIAEITGGRSFSAPSRRDLRSIYDALVSRFRVVKERQELTAAFAGAGILLAAAAVALSTFRTTRFP